MRPWKIYLFLSLATVVIGLLSEINWSAPTPSQTLERVAHAGGAIGERRYSNSAEAIQSSLEKGFRFIELDFVWTSDGHLVSLHGWGGTAEWMFGHVGPPLTLSGFEEASKRGRYTALSLDGVAELMRRKPEMILVTDVKGDNLRALEIVAKTVPDIGNRVVPQIYTTEEYLTVRQMGFQRIIWTLYKYRHIGDIDRIVKEARGMALYAVCMPARLAKKGYALRLRDIGVASYVHTINEHDEWIELQDEFGAAEIYTDFLAPDRSVSAIGRIDR